MKERTRFAGGRFYASSVVSGLIALLGFGAISHAGAQENMTPVLMAVQDAPVSFMGSDERVHLVYELQMTNFSSGDVAVEKVEVLGDGLVLQTLDTADVATRLQPVGQREAVGSLAKSTQALLFINVTLAEDAAIPHKISHRVALDVGAAPPGQQEMSEVGGETLVDRREVVTIGPPLGGSGYISADSCCDATRHTRAALPVNGRVWVAQRYAVDWEQLNAKGQIYDGPQQRLESYAIFGRPVLAVADATVESVTDGLPEQTPGKYPTNISLDAADGNAIILDLGGHRYAMYAHLKPGSIKVHRGEKVKLGQVMAEVGNTGNSLAPHLHFQVMDGPSSLASNGQPYEIREFQITGMSAGTAGFDEAEEKGTPLAVTAVSPAQEVKEALPLDQMIISFAGR